MKENIEEITVKVKYDPNKNDTIDVKIRPHTGVLFFEQAIKKELRDNSINDIPMGILKFNGTELDDKGKTLEELGIKDGSRVENENRVVLIQPLFGKMIYITCDKHTTVREFLKQLKGKRSGWNYITLIFESTRLPRSMLDQKLLGYQINKSSINYGTTLNLIISSEEVYKNSDTVFDLNNLDDKVSDLNNLDDTGSELNNSEKSKNSNLVKESTTLEKEKDVFNLERLNNNPKISLGSKKEGKNSNYPLLRIIVGIADLLLLAAAVATFLLYFLTTLSLSVAVPIVLAALFVVGAILFFGWNTILPKILPDNCLKKPNLENTLDEKNKDKIEEIENNEKTNPEKKEKKDEKEEENDSL